MKKNFWTDYLSYTAFKLLGPVIRILPLGFIPFLGRTLGELMYYFDLKHKAIAYSNIKRALGGIGRKSLRGQLNALTKESFRVFGQNIIDILLIPLINRQYMDKYISIEGKQNIDEAFKRGKGIIFLSVHAGSWELSNVICANLGFPFRLFIRNQNLPRLNNLLNSYRRQKGCKIIERENEIRQLIEALKNNEAIGMTLDQGGRSGTLVKFFGKYASFATGAVKLALKYDATILPAFYTRLKGLYHEVIIEPPFKIKQTGDLEKNIATNLQELAQIFEEYIKDSPREYLWTYKLWKYSNHKDILILSDGKTGHLRQAEAAAKIISNYLKDKGISASSRTIELTFKNKFSRCLLTFCGCLAGKYHCQGCLGCLRRFLNKNSYEPLISAVADIVISCGSSVAAVNYVISKENQAKSIVIMRPSVLSFNKFDLVIMPRHDNPPKRKNVVMTEGALNLIDEDYLKEQSKELLETVGFTPQPLDSYVGLLIGGDTKDFHLDKHLMHLTINQIKMFLEKEDAKILVTTSRRTSPEIEQLVREEFEGYSRCKFLVIANEKNPPFAVGGFLALSQVVFVSPESISLVSEAASARRYVVVFKSKLDHRHRNFLDYLTDKKYIYFVEPQDICSSMDRLWRQRPQINVLKDKLKLEDALRRII